MLIPIALAVVVKPLMQNKAAKSNASFFIVVSSVLIQTVSSLRYLIKVTQAKMLDQDRFIHWLDPFSMFANQIL